MADPIRQLLSQTNYVADGSQTVWNFAFSGGYLDKSHVKAKYLNANRVEHHIAVTPGMFLGQYQLNITPPVAAGSELVIYRDTPKSGPLVDFADHAALTEQALDLNAKQAVFVAAESSDGWTTIIEDTTAQAVLAAAANDAAVASRDAAAVSAANALTSENAAYGQAVLAANAAATTQTLRDSIIATQGAIGYLPPVAYAAGLAITLPAQTVSYSGQAYAPLLSALPFTTSGTFEAAKFRLIQGVAAVDLAAADGSGLVGWLQSGAGAVLRMVQDKLRDVVSVRDFGALGNNVQTLYATSYASDVSSSPVTITQQTADALAINLMICALRANGGGTLYLPKGVYRTYGYLERIDFPCRIVGDGQDQTIIKNCDASPTNVNGYGIFVIHPAVLATVSIENLTLDGNATVRTQPTGELRSFPLVWYGYVNAKITNVTCRNSPIDCMGTYYAGDNTVSLQAVNLTLSNSYRNTLSLVEGWNQQYTNCLIEKGGKVYTGTNPKYCLDIEPGASTRTIRNITFTNTTIREAVNVLAGGVWAGNVQFNACTLEATDTEWIFSFRGGEFTFNGGLLLGNPATRASFARFTNPIGTGEFATTEFVALKGTLLDGCGIDGYGLNMQLSDVVVKNSRRPVLFGGNGTQQLLVSNMRLINVIDVANAGLGTYSAFAIKNTFEGYIEIDGLHVRIDQASLPATPAFTATTAVYGIYLAPALSAAEAKISNVHVAGYYRKFPTAMGHTLNVSTFRDWNVPPLPPADTAGQTAGPGVLRYRNCTGYGDSA